MRNLALLLLVVTACRTTRSEKFFIAPADPSTLRHTANGDVVGGAGRYGSQAWLGIPFAEPPVGELRWKAARPAKDWSGVRDATHFGRSCAQVASPLGGESGKEGEIVGSEDCLTLNVWAPPNAKGLPVMVWIHGGGNSIGSASFYEGGHLATSQNVVVVSTQYRLGPLGWFRHKALRAEEEDQSGNYGTLDLIRALRWVQENAVAFGGDPGNVTIFGESAGGTNVYTLLLAKPAKGLFHRAIVESGFVRGEEPQEAEAFTEEKGNVFSSNEIFAASLVKDGKAAGRAEAKQLIASMSDTEAAAYLRSKTPAEIIKLYGNQFGMLKAPLVFRDGDVLPKGDWMESLAQADGWNRVPVILGTNRDELKLFMFIDPKRTWKLFGILPRYRDEANYQVEASVMSRVWKALGVDAPAEAMRRSGATDVYAYRFDWDQEPSFLGTDLKQMVGAAHGMEIPFVFGHFDMGPMNRLLGDDENGERAGLSKEMMKLWATFAYDGKPGEVWKSDPGTTLLLNVASEGGIRMSDVHETLEKIVMSVDTDARLKTQRERCVVFHDLAAFRGREQVETYELSAHGTCEQFPFEKFPWD